VFPGPGKDLWGKEMVKTCGVNTRKPKRVYVGKNLEGRRADWGGENERSGQTEVKKGEWEARTTRGTPNRVE